VLDRVELCFHFFYGTKRVLQERATIRGLGHVTHKCVLPHQRERLCEPRCKFIF
jgi:hypothetical protein